MTTYADILAKREQIINLVAQFNYSSNVKIKYDLPDGDSDDAVSLYFIISEINPNAPANLANDSYLSAMLSQLLGCEANVSVEQRIDVLGRYDVAKKSALLTDDNALKEVIFRVQQSLPTDAAVEESSLATIKFDEIVCKDIPESDRRLQKILLSQANDYLKRNKTGERSISNSLTGSPVIAPKNTHGSDSETPPLKKARAEYIAASNAVQLLIPLPNNVSYDKDSILSQEVTDEIAKDILARISTSMIKSSGK